MSARRLSAKSSMQIESLESRNYLSTLPPVFGPSNVLLSAVSATTVRIEWLEQVVGQSIYVIERSTDDFTFEEVIDTPVGAHRAYDATVEPNTTYYYRVFARIGSNESEHVDALNSVTLLDGITTLAANAPAQIDTAMNQLNIRGTAQNDIITLRMVSGDLVVNVNGKPIDDITFALTDFQRINILGLSGNDRIFLADDVPAVNVNGGNGNDTIVTGPGNDRINGGRGRDLIRAGEGNDTIAGGGENDTLLGQAGDDVLDGGDGNDVLRGGDGNDTIYGGAGRDRLFGEGGDDLLFSITNDILVSN
jgi:Ca2+-binding RTX toxin-like protein